MIILLSLLLFKINPPSQKAKKFSNRLKEMDYSNVQYTDFSEENYESVYISCETSASQINIANSNFTNIIPESYDIESSMIVAKKCKFQLTMNKFNDNSFSNSMILSEDNEYSTESNEINNCYNFDKKLSNANIIHCIRSIVNLQKDKINFKDHQNSCRGIYLMDCSDSNLTDVDVNLANLPENDHGCALLLTAENEICQCTMQGGNIDKCGNHDCSIYTNLNVMSISKTKLNHEAISGDFNGIYFAKIGQVTLSSVQIMNIRGYPIVFSDDEGTFESSSIKLIDNCIFMTNLKNVLFKTNKEKSIVHNCTFSSIYCEKTLLSIDGKTRSIEFQSCIFSDCPLSDNIFDIPDDNREFTFEDCSFENSKFSNSANQIYFRNVGKYTIKRSTFSGSSFIFSDENTVESDIELKIEMEDVVFNAFSTACTFKLNNPTIKECTFKDVVLDTTSILLPIFIGFNSNSESVTIDSFTFTNISSIRKLRLIDIPDNANLYFTMKKSTFNSLDFQYGYIVYTNNKIKSITLSNNNFNDCKGKVNIDIDNEKYNYSPQPVTISNCNFVNHQSISLGGAIYIESTFAAREFIITGCLFQNCKTLKENAKSPVNGAAIFFSAYNGNINQCRFIDNVAERGIDIYYNINNYPNDEWNNECLIIERNTFSHTSSYEKQAYLLHLDGETKVNYYFHHNKIYFDKENTNVFLFGTGSADAGGTGTGGTGGTGGSGEVLLNGNYTIIDNCMDKSTEGQIKISTLNYEITYESAFQWDCFSTEGCPFVPENGVVISDGGDFSSTQNAYMFSCIKTFNKRIIIKNSILYIYLCEFTSIQPQSNFGGAIYITIETPVSSLENPIEIFNCTFDGCENSHGGAIYLRSVETTRKYDIRDCEFTSNKATKENPKGNGAALYLNALNVNIENCTFIGNEASQDGGSIYYEYSDQPASSLKVLEKEDDVYALRAFECTFESSKAGNNGGGICINVKKDNLLGRILIDSCDFYECEATSNGGGGIHALLESEIQDNILINSCTIINCSSGFGGGCCIISTLDSNTVLLNNTIFKGNEATRSAASDEYEEGQFGGASLFLTIKNGTIFACKFSSGIGKKGSVKIYNNFNTQKGLLLTNELNSLLSINSCEFESDKHSSSIVYVRGKNEAIPINIVECTFIGELDDGIHHIEGVSLSKKTESPKLIIESCKFSSDEKSAIDSSLKKFASFDVKKQEFSMVNKTKVKNHDNNNNLLGGFVAAVACAAFCALASIFVVKRKKVNQDEINENKEIL